MYCKLIVLVWDWYQQGRNLVVTKVWIMKLSWGRVLIMQLSQIDINIAVCLHRELIALLKISPLSIFETTPPLTESGIFFIFPQFVILIAHLTLGWCFKNLSDCRDASVRPEIVSLGYFFRCWLILHVSTTEVVRLCNVYLVRCSRWHVCKIAYRLLSQELRWESFLNHEI